jgi:prolipoprotein diacylglyceryl transferase
MEHMRTEFPSPPFESFTVGPFTVHMYALCILVGIAVAYLIGSARFKKRGGSSGDLLDVVLWAVPIGIFGGRLFHVFTHPGDYFGVYPTLQETLYHVVAVWEGGLAIYGALIAGTFGAWLGARLSNVRFVSVLDTLAPGIILAQAIGRWGNWFNQELFGQATDVPWGLKIPSDNPAVPKGFSSESLYHPTFLYEFLLNIVAFVILLLIDKRFELRWGKLFAMYLVFYSSIRFFVEGIRLDPSAVFYGLRTNQWSAVIGLLIGLALFYIQTQRHPGSEPSVNLEPKPKAKAKPNASAKSDVKPKPKAKPKAK